MVALTISGHSSSAWIGRCLPLLPVALIIGCIAHYGVNVPFADDWDLSSFVSKAVHHKVLLKHLLQQHNEHRIFFLKLVVAAQAWLPYWDLRIQMFVSVVLCGLTAGNMFILIKRTLPLSSRARLAIWFCITVLLFSPVQYENWIWGFQCAFFFPPLCLSASWVVLTSNMRMSAKFWLSAFLTTVATFSFSTGLFGWLLSFPLFIYGEYPTERRKMIRWFLCWFGAAGVCLGGYLIGYHEPVHSTRILTGFHPFLYAEYALVFLGGGLFRTATDQATTVPFVAGAALTTLYLASLGSLFRRGPSSGLARTGMPWAAFGAFAIAGAILCAIGRRPFMPAIQALESRYTTVSLMLLVSLLGLLVVIGRDLKTMNRTGAVKAIPWIAGAGMGVLATGYAVSLPFSFEQMAELRSYHLDGKAALQYSQALRDPGLAEAIMTATLYPSVEAIRGFVQLLDGVNRFRPALVKSPRMHDDGASIDANRRNYGRLESIATVDNQYSVSGWAILPERHERADGIVLAFREPSGAWIALTMATGRSERPDINKAVGDASLRNIGWKVSFPATVLPPGADELSAWAIDATTGKSYLLDGAQRIAKEN
jgi:hypothetical protein